MQLESAHISNFRLLDDVSIKFSTDWEKPLTVIRGENASGKTSLLYALRWALYGNDGIPRMSITSKSKPLNVPINVQVQVEFNEEISTGRPTRYRLIRSCEETRTGEEQYRRKNERARLFQVTEEGDKKIDEGSTGLLAAMFPLNLSDVFFTNGDDIQRFIADAQTNTRERQNAVHKTIRQVLGMSDMEQINKDFASAEKRYARQLSGSESSELTNIQKDLESLDEKIEEAKSKITKSKSRELGAIKQIETDEQRLDDIKGHGNLDSIRARVRGLEQDIERLEKNEITIRSRIKDMLCSKAVSRRFIDKQLKKGLAILKDLADRNVLPGTSVEILKDRLELGMCICGESLLEGNLLHKNVSKLIEKQQQEEPLNRKLTDLFHKARNENEELETETKKGNSYSEQASRLNEELIQNNDALTRKESDLKAERIRLGKVDNEEVQRLTKRINSNRTKVRTFTEKRNRLEYELEDLEESQANLKSREEKAIRSQNKNKSIKRRWLAAADLNNLTSSILQSLKTDYVKRVSRLMNDRFLEIIGTDPDSDTAIYTGVRIDALTYDIIVESREEEKFDHNYEVNGAAQRALTLSFIWALMEVAEKEAPRIIDTPLGMTSGHVKRRAVESLTKPICENELPYQVVLFMTRSEIKDVEDLIDNRAGEISTLSCSSNYPNDLANDWGYELPKVRVCHCNHRQICKICERRLDEGEFMYREEKQH